MFTLGASIGRVLGFECVTTGSILTEIGDCFRSGEKTQTLLSSHGPTYSVPMVSTLGAHGL